MDDRWHKRTLHRTEPYLGGRGAALLSGGLNTQLPHLLRQPRALRPLRFQCVQLPGPETAVFGC